MHAGHDKHAGHSVEMFRQKFWGTLLLSVPTIVWAPMIQQWFGYEAPGGPVASRWIPALFGSLVFGYGGWVFIRGAKGELADRRPGMMTLIALAITYALNGLREIGEPARKALITTGLPSDIRARAVGLYWGLRSFAFWPAPLAAAALWTYATPQIALLVAGGLGMVGTAAYYLFVPKEPTGA